jgi:putative aldouronate transport system substrate-binding protein
MYPTYGPLPPAMGGNEFWQELNKQTGATLDFVFVTASDYAAKFQTALAGGQLADIVVVPQPVPDQPRLMQRVFEDLAPYLSGAAAKQYPFLANIATASWRYTRSGNGLYALPQPRALSGATIFARSDIFDEAGVNASPASYQEFLELMKSVTDPKKHRWAFDNPTRMLMHVQMMLGVQNQWRETSGTLARDYTDPGTKQAIGLVADMVKAGLFHPDAATANANFTQSRVWFTSGQVVMHSDGYAAWDIFTQQIGEKVTAVAEPKFFGSGDAAHFAGDASQALTSIRKGVGEDKVRKLLNLLNWLAAPIGTHEHLTRKYGVEGVHYTWQGSVPQPTARGTAERIDVQYVIDAPTILGPGDTGHVTRQHDWQVRITKNLVPNPAVGLYSDTQSKKGAQLQNMMTDAQNDIFFGRKPLSSWDDAVKQWKSQGGDKITAEYTQAFHDA